MLWTMSLSSIFLNSSSMRSQIKAELEAVARSLFHSPRTNSLKASPVCAQIKSLMNIFAKHQKSGWCWSSAQPRPWRFGWKDSAATSNGPGASGAGETLDHPATAPGSLRGCPSAVLAGVRQGGVTARAGSSREKGRTCRDAQPKGRHQTGSRTGKGRIQVTAHLAGDPKAGL